MIVKNLSTELYDTDAILETVDSIGVVCDLEIIGPKNDKTLEVRFLAPFPPETDLDACVRRFIKLLIRNSLRKKVSDQTRTIRDLIVLQAFTEAEFEADNLDSEIKK